MCESFKWQLEHSVKILSPPHGVMAYLPFSSATPLGLHRLSFLSLRLIERRLTSEPLEAVPGCHYSQNIMASSSVQARQITLRES